MSSSINRLPRQKGLKDWVVTLTEDSTLCLALHTRGSQLLLTLYRQMSPGYGDVSKEKGELTDGADILCYDSRL